MLPLGQPRGEMGQIQRLDPEPGGPCYSSKTFCGTECASQGRHREQKKRADKQLKPVMLCNADKG